ncbi:cytochrome c biogenesis heme-transporting ATPase CcmA [Candidatus Thioglobus sp.]|jgi:heme ABC exporter, ATP-binding protein CcmA|uniref:cytochrome c biogenesis heme-transporting ATPase CcmA n=1 Tax=Candidatus Thioglobus sp. TaxID=2026721 RepID=UPI001777F7C7|nr:cytochrome c biogenesis heme-transporting ATPase CcmA [Candidatus Thioglobus sp.]
MLKITNLSCQRGYNQLFSNLSFSVDAGDILRISGTNGSGKTSLLKILAGLNVAEEGKITFKQHSVKSAEYQQEIFYLGHLSALSSELSTIENLEFLARLNQCNNRIPLTQALEGIGLKGYEDEYCAKLSAGQKRRTILAGLFLSKAKVWLLDEPFTALDPIGIDIVEKSISKHCKQGGICVFTTHQDSTLPNQKVLTL